ncbi:hypothetical protein C1637_02045 [Chryseobacterium lactis]|uniref:V-type ATPase 116kDa subunit family protein n=1 Tax=Chryseobacterium lactis TaxID=1241981 RepID=A0A3G6RPZ6_CHRLC|nr:hypothetical protein [Chryseobacterium lactis]AZA81379.1 hypothetical protein EG342_05430 [Chryseobacterium lactis]AZB06378.1 hypothetical protein EG341_21555 [Chryseobacterium lactis]PNW15230.1 hypothetical protein C1637_02045 [Chryseobacterium lactis]
MQNIQDLKEKIFFESMNIIDNLDKINNVDELLSKQDLVDELANRISFLKLLEKNIEYFVADDHLQHSENKHVSFASGEQDHHHDHHNEVTEEEAIFNNELNEIDEHENDHFLHESNEEEAVFNNQLNEIVENEFHENIVSFAAENYEGKPAENSEETLPDPTAEDDDVFNSQLNDIENESSETEPYGAVMSFVDEEKILSDAHPDSDEDINEEMFTDDVTEEEAIFNNQLNEIDQDENISEPESKNDADHAEITQIRENTVKETIPSIFDTETLDDEMLIEESEEQFSPSNSSIEQGELVTETSNVDNILSEIKNDHSEEEKKENILAEVYDRRKIVEIDKPVPEETEIHPSDESFENLDEYHQEKKIKLSNIKGLKAVQSLFDDDPLERETPKEIENPAVKEDTGSILKSNIPTNFMEAEKQKPEFKLDLNDRIAFSKMLFEGSQTDLNDAIAQLNHFRTLEEAKEYLSDLYYDRKWSKVDEYAQRLWILVENKFL